jgi:NAD(P)-dependent dehydrogenase (short-subunit alcohol dehydrogenase family)
MENVMKGNLHGKVVLVTEGDTKAGRVTAIQVAKEGAAIALVYYLQKEEAEAVCRTVEKIGQKCMLIEGDIDDSRFLQQAIKMVIQELGSLDILINNATDRYGQLGEESKLCGAPKRPAFF